MRQIVITKKGGPEVLSVQEREDRPPGVGEVALRVRAAGINFADIMARKGLYPDAPKPPCVVGYEVSGIVEEVGDGVAPGLQGKAVLALTRFGGYARPRAPLHGRAPRRGPPAPLKPRRVECKVAGQCRSPRNL